MSKQNVIIIGAGPAGLMAAGQAAESGASVILLEKMSRPANKLRITGKGRCNLTNIAPVQEFISHFGRNGNFLRQAFSRFCNAELIDFFDKLGVATVTERGGRVFPASGEANEVAAAIIAWIRRPGITLETNARVEKLLVTDRRVKGVQISHRKAGEKVHLNEKRTYQADSVILAAGGASYPGTGSSGDGYVLAESSGHSIIEIRPALVPLETGGDSARRLEGLSLKNVAASAWINNKKSGEEFGDMIFTASGISGPIILTLSRLCVDALRQGNKVFVTIDLKPALDHKKLDERLLRDIKEYSGRSVKNMLKGLMPERLIQVCLETIDVQPEKTSNQMSSEERKRLRLWLKEFRLEVKGHRPFEEAIITAGGIDLKEINPRTMESRLVTGLYFAGEVLDIDADTGGYNLQAAFSTGWIAGRSAVGAPQASED